MEGLKENRYVKAFKSLRIWPLFERGGLFYKLRRKNTFWKEITEASAVRERIKDYLIRDPSYAVVDVACGKGFLSTLVALMHPKTRVIAVDADEGADRSHFKHLKNATFVRTNIMEEEFERLVREAGEKVILTGIHLCGELSERFLEVARSCPNVKVAVLMPCCEGNFPRPKYRFLIEEGKLYEAWCAHLVSLTGEEFKVRAFKDGDVLSPKNLLIHAERQSPPKSSGS